MTFTRTAENARQRGKTARSGHGYKISGRSMCRSAQAVKSRFKGQGLREELVR